MGSRSKKRSGPALSLAFDPGDAVRLLCGFRKERFIFERHILILTFSAWLIWPHKPQIVRHAYVAALANLLTLLDSGDLRVGERDKVKFVAACNKLLSPKNVADVILNRQVWSFSDELIGLDPTINDVIAIAVFIASTLPQQRPSFNKAMHFISSGGFADSESEAETAGTPASTLKNSWARLATSSPFLLAADICNCNKLWKLAPDNPPSFEIADAILADGDQLEGIFAVAMYVQQRMVNSLGPASLKRFSFVSFPPGLKPEKPEWAAMNDWQLSIIKSYKAPKPY